MRETGMVKRKRRDSPNFIRNKGKDGKKRKKFEHKKSKQIHPKTDDSVKTTTCNLNLYVVYPSLLHPLPPAKTPRDNIEESAPSHIIVPGLGVFVGIVVRHALRIGCNLSLLVVIVVWSGKVRVIFIALFHAAYAPGLLSIAALVLCKVAEGLGLGANHASQLRLLVRGALFAAAMKGMTGRESRISTRLSKRDRIVG